MFKLIIVWIGNIYIYEILSFYLNTISKKKKNKKEFIKILRDQERNKDIRFYLFISKIYFAPTLLCYEKNCCRLFR